MARLGAVRWSRPSRRSRRACPVDRGGDAAHGALDLKFSPPRRWSHGSSSPSSRKMRSRTGSAARNFSGRSVIMSPRRSAGRCLRIEQERAQLGAPSPRSPARGGEIPRVVTRSVAAIFNVAHLADLVEHQDDGGPSAAARTGVSLVPVRGLDHEHHHVPGAAGRPRGSCTVQRILVLCLVAARDRECTAPACP